MHQLTVSLLSSGLLMLLMTIMDTVHLISECLRTDKPSKPLAMEPCVTSAVRQCGDLKATSSTNPRSDGIKLSAKSDS